MERPANLLFATCLTMLVAATPAGSATAAEDEAPAQELVQVRATSWVAAAHWSRRTDTYALKIVLDTSRARGNTAAADPVPPAPAQQRPRVSDTPAPPPDGMLGIRPTERMDRGSLFIGNTIENLRGLDPVFSCGRTLTLVDGRRQQTDGVPTAPIPAPSPATSYMNQPYPAKYVDRRVEVWLLRANGVQILPVAYSCDEGPRGAPTSSPTEITYEFRLADGAQATAVAVRVGSDYYIEKLQPLVPRPAAP